MGGRQQVAALAASDSFCFDAMDKGSAVAGLPNLAVAAALTRAFAVILCDWYQTRTVNPMAEYRVLVVTNLWPSEADPSYGAAIRAQMESLRPFGVDYEALYVNGRKSAANYLRGIFEVRRRVARKKYDLIYAHFGLSGWVARFQRKVPVIVKFMGDDVLGQFDGRGRLTLMGRIYQLSSRILARRIEGAIVMSEEMKSKLRLQTAHVVPVGVNLDLFKPLDQAEARRSLGLDPGKKYVLFPYGEDRPAKRFDLVEEAVKLARREIPELEILQVSGVPQQQLPLYFNAADVFVLASESEGSPNSIKEALAVNLPVITVDVGDAAEVIRGTEGNYIVPRTAQAIAETLVVVCRCGGRTQGRERAEQFSLSEMARKVTEVYQSVLKRAR
jgi:glycosyltransferase involved in cell wall biosynthesis